MTDEQAPAVPDDAIASDAAPSDDDPLLERPAGGAEVGAGYDVDAVSGDTEIYRPD